MWKISFLSAPSARVSLGRRPRTENSTAPWDTVGMCQVMESFLPVTLQPSAWKAPPLTAPLDEPLSDSSRTTCWAAAAVISDASHASVNRDLRMIDPPIQGGLQESRESDGNRSPQNGRRPTAYGSTFTWPKRTFAPLGTSILAAPCSSTPYSLAIVSP